MQQRNYDTLLKPLSARETHVRICMLCVMHAYILFYYDTCMQVHELMHARQIERNIIHTRYGIYPILHYFKQLLVSVLSIIAVSQSK